jgi:dTDP-4-dehydrorhamnose 3,5-epimerase
MQIKSTNLDGVFLIENKQNTDVRGKLVKPFHAGIFEEHGLSCAFRESFYSLSQNGVIRGMHFQMPPFDHYKLVHVLKGEVLDVVLDIREDSPMRGQSVSFTLSEENAFSLYISKGFAHGFRVLSEVAIMLYFTTKEYSPEHDSGVRWDSFDFDWGLTDPILSQRDRMLPCFK